ncbi:MAG: hypothetical protein KF742_08230 [Cryobacterium sp.]|nr:hypothetical protein [Cryobacterium sp.]MBX3088465.1 hypothetical protein [Cryobacterium sp.]
MTDELDRKLASAGTFLKSDQQLDSALGDLASARAEDTTAKRTNRSTRLYRGSRLATALTIGSVLAAGSVGAFAITQWGPWNYVPQPDLVVARSWTDVSGNYLGSCESHMAVDTLPATARKLAVDYFNALDVDSVSPDPEWIASELQAVGRLDTIGNLVAGATPADFEALGDGWTGPTIDYFSDARILQDALTQKVFKGMSDLLVEQIPGSDYGWSDITARIETQCSTDPGRTGQQ